MAQNENDPLKMMKEIYEDLLKMVCDRMSEKGMPADHDHLVATASALQVLANDMARRAGCKNPECMVHGTLMLAQALNRVKPEEPVEIRSVDRMDKDMRLTSFFNGKEIPKA